MKALVKTEQQAVGFTTDEVNLIKNQIAKGATDLELKYFLELCRQSGLNPFTRQIYLIERKSWNQRTQQWETARVPQTSIDGFRAIAEDSEKYAGQVGPYWCGLDGEWHDVWVKDEPPVAARVGVLRDGFKEPLFAVAKFKEYVQLTKDGKPTKMWATMPDLMIAKCAESLALRKAFPQKLGGLYTSDEMAQAEVVREIEPPNPTAAALVDIASRSNGGVVHDEHGPAAPSSRGENAPQGGEVISDTAPHPTTSQGWRRFAEKMIKVASEGHGFTPEQQAQMSKMMELAPKMYGNMRAKIEEVMAAAAPRDVTEANGGPPQEPAAPKPEDDPDAYRMWLIDQMSRFDTKADLNKFFEAQRPLWDSEKCFPPDIDEWESLFKERVVELA